MSEKLIRRLIREALLSEANFGRPKMRAKPFRIDRAIERFQLGEDWTISNDPSASKKCGGDYECERGPLELIISPDPITGEGDR